MRTAGLTRFLLVGRITPMTEVLLPGRLAGTVLRVGLWIAVSTTLWNALYGRTPTAAGVTAGQTVTYVVVAAMVTQLRAGALTADTLVDHVHAGTVLYWFLRPMPPRRYYAARAFGDAAYALGWVACGYAVCLPLGVLMPPVSRAAACWATASLLLGQVIAHQIRSAVDLVCFWTVLNRQVTKLTEFVQTFLAGGFAPLWFFPDWFQAVSAKLPFQYVVSIPMSLYTGRLPTSAAPAALSVQLAWIAGMSALTHWMWSRAASRVTVQGG
ncbi:ABC transporter permease [Kitasatospora sp. NPDC058444]|uniref:ABC transporter permease n=1 Tax=Kitasatospora sp. NPDC058444 TaxID=3346504 RepID=UPI00365225BF